MATPDAVAPDATKAEATTVAAIDIGSNSLRMVIAEVLPDGRIEILERLQRAVRLGQDTFRRGRLGGQSMRAAVAVLRDYRQMLELYKVERIRAVATSAVREAANADTFVDRVFMATRLNLEVIATSEESRLIVSAVHHAIEKVADIRRDEALIADVGGGSTLLTVLQDGEIVNSQSLRLGSIRLQEMWSTRLESPQQSAELLRHHVATALATSQSVLPLGNVRSFVALGGDIRFAAREVGKPTSSPDLTTVDAADFDKLVERCIHHSAEELSRRHGLPFAEAETLNPALLVCQALLHTTQAQRMIVSGVSMRDGLLAELARQVTGEQDKAVLEGVIRSVTRLAQKFRVSLEHARAVAELSVRFFDELKPDHGLGPRYRLLLQVAALLHEVGGFVSNQSHHKHSYYLIRHSEIFGLTSHEILTVAHIARYHRRASPKPSHGDYMALPRETRLVVNKLAAILRAADAVMRGRSFSPDTLRIEHHADELTVHVPQAPDLILERRAVAEKGDLFEDIYGMKIRLVEA